MSGMLHDYSSLSSLPDISKWNTSNVIYIVGDDEISQDGMFFNCSSLSSLPDISKWNNNSATNISWMYFGCKSSFVIPKIFI